MFTLPIGPPKDYALRDVSNNQRSAAEFTPGSEPRVTQTTLGKYCYPVEPSKDDEHISAAALKSRDVNASVLDKWANRNRAWWVEKPSKSGFQVNEVFRKCSVKVGFESDPQFQHRPRIFQRSFKYELDSLEMQRQQKIRDKALKDACEDEQLRMRRGNDEADEDSMQQLEPVDESESAGYKRWQDLPRLFAPSMTNPCARRRAFQMFKQPFKHEACIFYYEHYPAPRIPFRPKKVI